MMRQLQLKKLLSIKLNALAFLVLIASLGTNVSASELPNCVDHSNLKTGQIRSVIDTRTIILQSGVILSPASLYVPQQQIALVEAYLLEKLAGNKIDFHISSDEKDRHGRLHAQIFLSTHLISPKNDRSEEKNWLQQDLISKGLALVNPIGNNGACVKELLSIEEFARRKSQGLWERSSDFLTSAIQVDKLIDLTDYFQIVEGRVISANIVKGTLFINFGRIWREDFTAIVEKPYLTRFRQNGVKIDQLNDKLVRIRGWLQKRGGPAIVLTRPEQMEIIDP